MLGDVEGSDFFSSFSLDFSVVCVHLSSFLLVGFGCSTNVLHSHCILDKSCHCNVILMNNSDTILSHAV